MDFLPPVVARLIADTGEFTAKFGEAQAKTEGFQAAQARMAAAGKVAMGALAIGVAAVGYESVKMAASFDQAMELVHTQAGASQAEVDQLKQKVLELAPTVGIGPERLAEGLYHVESAGFRGAQALDITAAAARDAAIGMGDMETTTQALIGVMASGIGGVRDAADAAAYLNQIVGIGDMRMDKLAASISTGILPSFRSAGLQMNDFGAALATITDNATPADEAATRLRMTVSLMAAPSHAAVKALDSIGIGSTQLADDLRKPNGLLVAVMDLKEHLEKSGKTASEQNQIIQQAFGGGKTSGAILTLLEESDRLKDKYHELGTSASRAAKFQDAWHSQQQQFTQQLHQLGAAAQVVGIQIGNWLIPKLQGTAEWLSHHIGVVKIAAVVIGSVLVAAMMAWTASVIANTVAMLANPTTWIILAIIAAIALLVVGIYELVKHWGAVWGWIKRIAVDVWHALVDGWHWLADTASHIWNDDIVGPIVSAWRTAGRWIDDAVSWFEALPGRIGAGLAALPGKLQALITEGIHRFLYMIGWGLGMALRFFVELPPKIWHLITSLWDGSVQLAAQGVRNMLAWIEDLKNRAIANVTAWWTETSRRVETGIDNMITWVAQLPGKVEAWFKEMWRRASYNTSKMLDEVLAFLRDLPGKAWTALKELPGKIWDAVKDAGHWLYDAGRNVVHGFLDGLKSMWTDAVNTVKGWGHDIAQGFKDAIGQHSPSRVFAESGDSIVAGLVQGIDRSAPDALAAITRMTAGISLTPAFALSYGAGLSPDMVTGLRGGGASRAAAAAGAVGQGTPAPAIVHAHLYLDGKELHVNQVGHAQRYKRRNGTTGQT